MEIVLRNLDFITYLTGAMGSFCLGALFGWYCVMKLKVFVNEF